LGVSSHSKAVDEKDLDVTLANGMLTVRGEKKTERDEQDKDKSWHVMEAQLWRVQSSDPPAVRSRPGDGRGEV
jgi:HSP20 family protein